jgi:hypothetical protein
LLENSGIQMIKLLTGQSKTCQEQAMQILRGCSIVTVPGFRVQGSKVVK